MSNTKSEDTQINPFGESDKCCKIVIENPATFVWGNCFNEKTHYTMQTWIKADSDKTINISVGNIATDVNVVDEWEQIIQTYNVQDLTSNSIYFNLPVGTYWFYNCKLEKGTRSTDYSTGDDDFFTEIHSAVEIAREKSRCIYSNVIPPGTEYDVGDTWFDTLHGNAISRWNGTTWEQKKLGTDAIAELSITNALIGDAQITDAKISNIDAGKITTGYLIADRIANNTIVTRMIKAGSITVDLLAADSVTADKIHAQTITADKLVLNSITSAQIASKTITANQIAANSITAAEMSVTTLSSITANIGTVTAGILKSPNYVAYTTGMMIDVTTATINSKQFQIRGTAGKIAGIEFTADMLYTTVHDNDDYGWGLFSTNTYENLAFCAGSSGVLYSTAPFKVYQDGSMSAGNGEFTVSPAGVTHAGNEFYVNTSRWGYCAVACTNPSQNFYIMYDESTNAISFFVNNIRIYTVIGN